MLLALIVTKERNSTVLAGSRNWSSFGAQTALDTKFFMLFLHLFNYVAAEEHLLFCESILKKLLCRKKALVLEMVNLSSLTCGKTYKNKDDSFVELHVVEMNGVWVDSVVK
jgi:hypothetical protein